MMTETSAVRPLSSCAGDDRSLCARIRAEFGEMPGLNLTLFQAARLFGVEPVRCARLLRELVGSGALWSDGHLYSRPGSSRHSH
jgi:hypothetical protein